MTDTTIPTSEVLYRAADLIEERGWGQGPGSMYANDGVCAMGAIHLAAFDRLAGERDNSYLDVHLCPAGQALYEYLVEGGVTDWQDDTIWEWNDDQSSSEPVIAAIRAAAVIEAAKENAETRQAVTA